MTVWSADTFLVKPRAAPPSIPDSRVYATHVQLATAPRLLAAARPRGVKKLGLAYERRVIDVLSAIYGSRFVPSPSILYTRHGRMHRAIPDGLLYLSGLAVIIEVKLAHTEAVWEQLMERYRPLVRLLHPTLRVRTVEICRSYDPAIDIPHSLITSLHSGCTPGLEVLHWRI